MSNDPAATASLEGAPSLEERVRAREEYILGRPPRIGPLSPEEFTPEIREIAHEMQRAVGIEPNDYIPDILATSLRYPELHNAHTGLALMLMSRGSLSHRDRELAVLRISWLCQAPFEWNAHVHAGKRVAGLTTEDVEDVIVGSSAPGWSDDDRALLRAVEELLDDAMISDETWAALATRMDDRQLLELPILVGQYIGVAYQQNSIRAALLPGDVGLTAR